MSAPRDVFATTIAHKAVMAVSGVVWFGYVIGHLLGNLQMYAGPAQINAYAAFLHDAPVLLWGSRLLLVATLLAHLIASVSLSMRNLAARPVAYARKGDLATTYAARTMIWTGPILLLFIAYHLAHLTFGVTPEFGYEPGDVYNNVVQSFRIGWLVALYVVAQLALCLHLYHGAWSFLQTLGVSHPELDPWRRRVAAVAALTIFAGYVSIPFAVLTGYLADAPPSVARRLGDGSFLLRLRSGQGGNDPPSPADHRSRASVGP